MVLIGTGIWLTFAFDPSPQNAYGSVLELTNRAQPIGYVIRQIHHWAAVCLWRRSSSTSGRIFFTGAFRRPRELNWVIGLTMLALASFTGFHRLLAAERRPLWNRSAHRGQRCALDSAHRELGRRGSQRRRNLSGTATHFATSTRCTYITSRSPSVRWSDCTSTLVIYQKHTQFVRDPDNVVGRRFLAPTTHCGRSPVLGATLALLALLAAALRD